VRGACKINSKLNPIISARFSFLDLVVVNGKNFYRLIDGETRERFSGLIQDYQKILLLDNILKKALKGKADIEVKDSDNAMHAVYRISDKKLISSIQKTLENKKLFIADGHHRYETALNYKKHIKQMGKKAEGISAQATLMYFYKS